MLILGQKDTKQIKTVRGMSTELSWLKRLLTHQYPFCCPNTWPTCFSPSVLFLLFRYLPTLKTVNSQVSVYLVSVGQCKETPTALLKILIQILSLGPVFCSIGFLLTTATKFGLGKKESLCKIFMGLTRVLVTTVCQHWWLLLRLERLQSSSAVPTRVAIWEPAKRSSRLP